MKSRLLRRRRAHLRVPTPAAAAIAAQCARPARMYPRGLGLLVSPPLRLGHRAVPQVVRRAVATVGEGRAKGKIGCSGYGLQPRTPIRGADI